MIFLRSTYLHKDISARAYYQNEISLILGTGNHVEYLFCNRLQILRGIFYLGFAEANFTVYWALAARHHGQRAQTVN
ncbi:hypothetical protein DLD77_04095 [Chitinophaga alhagiae]|uniref:Uncharacterized protein n=1 Tax=Chitinophaga alhagiae TaxID=2203219 RepID=A0ABM6WAC0_9BACT|nr:hypothetical protein DLD77_04095 [Chitinophaga alhagiae]